MRSAKMYTTINNIEDNQKIDIPGMKDELYFEFCKDINEQIELTVINILNIKKLPDLVIKSTCERLKYLNIMQCCKEELLNEINNLNKKLDDLTKIYNRK